MEYLDQYNEIIAIGILLNITTTFGFGFYKSLSISEEEAIYLVEKYQAKAGLAKLVLLWFVPFAGFLYVFKEVVKLQFAYINRGLTVFNYIEDNLKK